MLEGFLFKGILNLILLRFGQMVSYLLVGLGSAIPVLDLRDKWENRDPGGAGPVAGSLSGCVSESSWALVERLAPRSWFQNQCTSISGGVATWLSGPVILMRGCIWASRGYITLASPLLPPLPSWACHADLLGLCKFEMLRVTWQRISHHPYGELGPLVLSVPFPILPARHL